MARKAAAKPAWTPASDPQPAIAGPLSELGAVRLETVAGEEKRHLWNALAGRRHYLGYRRPFGEHIRYFLVDSAGRRLGCMLFESPTRYLPCRDRRIGLERQGSRPPTAPRRRGFQIPRPSPGVGGESR